jgi:Uma2 family endonuclease
MATLIGTPPHPLTYMLVDNASRRNRKFWDRADLVVEVISESNRDHDRVTKRREDAMNEIPEYWIVDPENRVVTVLVLDGKQYRVHGEFRDRQSAASHSLAGFTVDVRKLLDDAEAEV